MAIFIETGEKKRRSEKARNKLKIASRMPTTNRKLKSRLWLPKQFIIYCYQSSTNILQAKIYFYIVRLTDQFPINAFCEAQRGTNAYPHNMSLVFCNSFGSRRWAKNTQNQIGICAFLIAVRTRECSKVA